MVIKSEKIEFHNCILQKNTAYLPDGKRGVINVMSSTSMVNHTNITTNVAHYGGALNIEITQRVVVWDCYFTYTTAKSNGGAILMDKDSSEVKLYAYSKFITTLHIMVVPWPSMILVYFLQLTVALITHVNRTIALRTLLPFFIIPIKQCQQF